MPRVPGSALGYPDACAAVREGRASRRRTDEHDDKLARICEAVIGQRDKNVNGRRLSGTSRTCGISAKRPITGSTTPTGASFTRHAGASPSPWPARSRKKRTGDSKDRTLDHLRPADLSLRRCGRGQARRDSPSPHDCSSPRSSRCGSSYWLREG